jgi:hypothetical protein
VTPLPLAAAVVSTGLFACGGGDRGATARHEPATDTPVLIAIDPSELHQTINGWEAVAAWHGLPHDERFMPAVVDQAVDDLGINRVRLEVASGVEHTRDAWAEFEAGTLNPALVRTLRYATVNDNDDPGSIDWRGFQFTQVDRVVERIINPLRDRLAKRNESLFVNATYVSFLPDDGWVARSVHRNPEEYAEFVLATYLHLQQKYGWVPDSWEVILEPDTTATWQVNRLIRGPSYWPGDAIGRAVAASGRRLAAAGFTPRFVAPSTTSMSRATDYFDEAMRVPEARRYITTLSYHRYRGVSREALDAISDRAARYGVETAMLEYIGADYEVLHEDLTHGRNSAWAQYTLAFPERDNGAQYLTVDLSDPTRPRVAMSTSARYLRQYFKFIRRGARRIGATTSNGAFDPVAFVHPAGEHVVVIKAQTGGTVTVQGLPAGTYGVTYEIGTRDGGTGTDVTVTSAGALTASIPGRGVLTIARASAPRDER